MPARWCRWTTPDRLADDRISKKLKYQDAIIQFQRSFATLHYLLIVSLLPIKRHNPQGHIIYFSHQPCHLNPWASCFRLNGSAQGFRMCQERIRTLLLKGSGWIGWKSWVVGWTRVGATPKHMGWGGVWVGPQPITTRTYRNRGKVCFDPSTRKWKHLYYIQNGIMGRSQIMLICGARYKHRSRSLQWFGELYIFMHQFNNIAAWVISFPVN